MNSPAFRDGSKITNYAPCVPDSLPPLATLVERYMSGSARPMTVSGVAGIMGADRRIVGRVITRLAESGKLIRCVITDRRDGREIATFYYYVSMFEGSKP